ncbi:hypothetical protein SAMN04244548_00044 [Paracoccus pantotrophus]|nr:hypothetical protein SAMN04244548_00044 [Paracoccus pantotrophus]
MPQENSTDKASVETRLLASIELIDASQVCALLRIDADDPEGVLQAMAREDAIITLTQNGRTMAPLFQFDAERGQMFDVVGDILRLRPPYLSNLMLCYWLTRAHVDFGCAPVHRFGHDDTSIVAAFRRHIEPVRHG